MPIREIPINSTVITEGNYNVELEGLHEVDIVKLEHLINGMLEKNPEKRLQLSAIIKILEVSK